MLETGEAPAVRATVAASKEGCALATANPPAGRAEALALPVELTLVELVTFMAGQI
jgi:hypothetical protein